jgi:hypothetical protein
MLPVVDVMENVPQDPDRVGEFYSIAETNVLRCVESLHSLVQMADSLMRKIQMST